MGRVVVVPPKTEHGWWILGLLLFSMLSEGVVIPVLGRAPNLTLFEIFLPIIVLYLVAQNFLGDYYAGFYDKTILYLGLIYLLAHFLSLLVNYQDVLRGLVAIKIFAFGFLTYWVLNATVRSKTGLERATNVLILWGAVLGLILLYRFVEDWSSVIGPEASYEVKNQINIFGWARNNYLAALLVPILPLTVGTALAKRGIQRMLMILAVGLMAFGILITLSKGAILSLIFGSLCAVRVFRRAGIGVRHLLAFVLFAAGFLIIIPTDLIATNYNMFVYFAENSDVGRLDLLRVAWHEFQRNPIFGVGPYCIYIYNYQAGIDDLYTHNFVLNVLADLGLLGAIPFLALIAMLVRRSYKSCLATHAAPEFRWISVGLFVGILSTLANGLVEPTFPSREYSVIFWVCASLIFLYDPSRSTILYKRVGDDRPVSLVPKHT